MQNTEPFDNLQSYAYWSGTEYAPDPAGGLGFFTGYGYQGGDFKGSGDLYVWPVRSGQSAVAAEPPQPVPTLSEWGLIRL